MGTNRPMSANGRQGSATIQGDKSSANSSSLMLPSTSPSTRRPRKVSSLATTVNPFNSMNTIMPAKGRSFVPVVETVVFRDREAKPHGERQKIIDAVIEEPVAWIGEGAFDKAAILDAPTPPNLSICIV